MEASRDHAGVPSAELLRARWAKVIGVLSIVLAAWDIYRIVLTQASAPLRIRIYSSSGWGWRTDVGSQAVLVGLDGLLIFAGACLLRGRRAAIGAHVAYAGIAAGWILLCWLEGIVSLGPGRHLGPDLIYLSNEWGLRLVYPVFLFAWFARRKMRNSWLKYGAPSAVRLPLLHPTFLRGCSGR